MILIEMPFPKTERVARATFLTPHTKALDIYIFIISSISLCLIEVDEIKNKRLLILFSVI